MASPKLQALQTLQKQLPVASRKIAAGLKTAQDLQMQEAVAKAPTGGAIAPAAQSTAAAATAATGTQQTEAAKQMIGQAETLGRAELGERQMGAAAEVAAKEQAATAENIAAVERLGKLNLEVRKDLFDKQQVFKKDQAGRTLFNQRQLADWAVENARSEEDYKNKAAMAEQLLARKKQAMKTAAEILEQNLIQAAAIAEQQKDFEKAKQILQIKQQLARQKARMQAEANNAAATWGAVATAGGAVVGGLIGGPGGAVAGAKAGQASAPMLQKIFGG